MKRLLYEEPSVRILNLYTNDIITASKVDDENFNLDWLNEGLLEQ